MLRDDILLAAEMNCRCSLLVDWCLDDLASDQTRGGARGVEMLKD